eukprot:4629499-Amphidinium_carterae.1
MSELIVRMPLSGSVPVKRFVEMAKLLRTRITWRLLPGSAPSKPFLQMSKVVTVLIVKDAT